MTPPNGYGVLEDGRVQITMPRADYERLLMALGVAWGCALRAHDSAVANAFTLLTNRLNAGNPHYTQVEVPETTEPAT